MLTFGAAVLAAFGVFMLGQQLGPALADAVVEAEHGTQRRKAAGAAARAGARLEPEDFVFAAYDAVDGEELMFTQAEVRYLEGLTANDWKDPKVIRMLGEIVAEQPARRQRVGTA